MAVKLYNRTRLPDDLLLGLLARTARRIGARSGIIVKVTRARSRCTGEVKEASAVREWWVRRRNKDGALKERLIETDCAYMRLALVDYAGCDAHALHRAGVIIDLMLHEWAHVRDNQRGEDDYSRRGASGRRPAWADRPEEVRAQFAAKCAGKTTTDVDDDLELELVEALRKTWR